MDLIKDWKAIRAHFNRSFRSNLHVAIASVNQDSIPTVTPIGSLFLDREETKGFYFEKYASKLPAHAKENKNICILMVNSSKWFWIKSLFYGKFSTPPGIKLYGQLGQLREATSTEINWFKKRTSLTKSLKGHQYLWTDMSYVREIVFTKADQINLGRMTAGF